ncbi:hypothetical protein [Streptomyces sp. NPDC051909]|uniref:hypothetical protein n=1 Tax=Streptomyces sp. NPDC051909 TaxID=3154944 RepID=UPI00344364EF
MISLPRFVPTPVFRLLGLTPPPHALVWVLPTEPGVDSVLLVRPAPGRAFVLAIDVQGRRNPVRARAWTAAVARLRERYGAPAFLLAVCSDRATAVWAAGPFTTGLGSRSSLSLRPLVLGPTDTPPVTTAPAAAADLAGAVFAALAHARGSRATAALTAVNEALRTAAPETRVYCTQLLKAGLGDGHAGYAAIRTGSF